MTGAMKTPTRRKRLTTSGALAIDIRRDVVYLVHVEGRSGQPTRARFRREPIDPSLYSENPLEAAASAIGRMTQGLDLRKIPATVVLPNNREAIRVKRFPPMRKRALASAADITMRADALSAAEETVRRHFVQRHGEASDGSRFSEVVLIEAGARAVEEAEALARLAGLRLVRVTSPALALGRAAAALCPPSQTCLVVDLYGPGTTLNVYAGGRFLLSREGDVAADHLSGDLEAFLAMADAPSVPRGRADEPGVQMRRSSDAIALAEPSGDATLPVSPQKLATEIDRSNRYLVAQFRHTIDAIYFAGPSMLGRALADEVAPALGLPIELFAPEKILAAEALEGAPTCSSARCLGAALELIAPARQRRYDLIGKSRTTVSLPIPAIAAAGVVLLVGAPLGVLEWRMARANGTLRSLHAREASAAAALVPAGASASPEDVRALVDAFRTLRAEEPRWSRPLEALAGALPEGVWLTGIAPEAEARNDSPTLGEVLAGEGAGADGGASADDGSASGAAGDAAPAPRVLLSGRSRTIDGVFELIARLETTGHLSDPRLITVERPDRAATTAAVAPSPSSVAVPPAEPTFVSADRVFTFLMSVGATVVSAPESESLDSR